MHLKGIISEDFVNYRKICMTIIMPYCNGFKCGAELCQNSDLATAPIAELQNQTLINKFLTNDIVEAICFQGLEPFDSADELFEFIKDFRKIQLPTIWTNDIYNTKILGYKDNDADIVIYTGYTEEELEKMGYLTKLKDYGIMNIILKVGRYVPNQKKHYDDILGVYLASDNQYGIKVC